MYLNEKLNSHFEFQKSRAAGANSAGDASSLRMNSQFLKFLSLGLKHPETQSLKHSETELRSSTEESQFETIRNGLAVLNTAKQFLTMRRCIAGEYRHLMCSASVY